MRRSSQMCWKCKFCKLKLSDYAIYLSYQIIKITILFHVEHKRISPYPDRLSTERKLWSQFLSKLWLCQVMHELNLCVWALMPAVSGRVLTAMVKNKLVKRDCSLTSNLGLSFLWLQWSFSMDIFRFQGTFNTTLKLPLKGRIEFEFGVLLIAQDNQ